MYQLILDQQYLLFFLIAFALIFSLTFHEYGHGKMASLIGDDTAQRAGRVTLNPIPHIAPLGLLMVLIIGFGYAKPVPADASKFNTRWGVPLVAAAGPGMNLLLAFVTYNLFLLGQQAGFSWLYAYHAYIFFTMLASINLLLMLFNLLPIGPLDGSYMLPYLLPAKLARRYIRLNRRYGVFVLLGLLAIMLLLDLLGVPVVEAIWKLAAMMIKLIAVV